MEIKTTEVSGIASAVLNMRNPMISSHDSEFAETSNGLELTKLGEDDLRLLTKLAKAKSGSGHDCVLKSITVHMNITATHDFFLQLYRYHFRDTTSSTSKMHSITKGDIGDKCSKWVSMKTIYSINSLISEFNEKDFDRKRVIDLCKQGDIPTIPDSKSELFECIIHNTPIGYQLTVGEVTNYLQLKSMYNQRKSHKMSSWNTVFVDWIKTLPYSFLITGENQ